MTRVYYKEAVGAFIVFDVTRVGTFDAVAKWKADLDSKVRIVLLDRPRVRAVRTSCARCCAVSACTQRSFFVGHIGQRQAHPGRAVGEQVRPTEGGSRDQRGADGSIRAGERLCGLGALPRRGVLLLRRAQRRCSRIVLCFCFPLSTV